MLIKMYCLQSVPFMPYNIDSVTKSSAIQNVNNLVDWCCSSCLIVILLHILNNKKESSLLKAMWRTFTALSKFPKLHFLWHSWYYHMHYLRY